MVVAGLERVLLMEEILWRQKSRALWLKEGEKCTKFFYIVADSHRQSNAIEILHSNNQVLSSLFEIEDCIVHYYENLLIKPANWRLNLNGLVFESFDPQRASWLERPFEEMSFIR